VLELFRKRRMYWRTVGREFLEDVGEKDERGNAFEKLEGKADELRCKPN